jgi:hypothetical protein
MMIGLGLVPPVAGSRMVEGGGFVIPAHGLGLVVVQVMLVGGVLLARPRASMTAPVAGYGVLVPLRIPFSTWQKLEPLCANMLASMNELDPTTTGLPLLQLVAL